MKLFCKILFALTLSSCSAEWHLTRAILKDPTIIQNDTIRDTIITPERIASDSVVLPKLKPCALNLTIPINQNGVRGQIYIRDTVVSYRVVCESDTIYRTNTTQKIIYRDSEEKSFWSNLERIIYGLVALLAVLLVLRFIPKK